MNRGRMGYTTGACAAAAAKAALLSLSGKERQPARVEIPFPNGERHSLDIAFVRRKEAGVEAAVVKDAGDDPDITDGALVVAFVDWGKGEEIVFLAGEGVGTVTKKGLVVPPGEPAINPGPRQMIRAALEETSPRPVRVTISIPGGRELAQKTFNPRLGIENGLSILGTTGRVRPFSCRALRCSLVCALDVAHACGVREPVLVPGHIGEESARRHLAAREEQIIEVGNEWGFVLRRLHHYGFQRTLLFGHPGKLAKLADRQWDTHSTRSRSPVETLIRFGKSVLKKNLPESNTTEGIFAALRKRDRELLARALAEGIAHASRNKTKGLVDVSVVLINMAGDILGTHGDVKPWEKTNEK